MEDTQTTLRDTIAEQVDALEEAVPSSLEPAVEPQPSGEPAQDDKPGRTAGRARDELGRLLPGKVDKEIQPQVADAATPGAVPATAPTPAAEAIPRPSSWKKEMWEHFDKLPPEVARYINQREGEYARGVSTYRQEYENARPVMEAIAPNLPMFQQHGIEPAKQIAKYIDIHKTFALGDPQSKVAAWLQLQKDYNIPLDMAFVRGQDGQLYLNNQLHYTPPAPQAQDMDKLIESKLMEKEAQQAARLFAEVKDAQGNLSHPHFDTVRETMRQLLEAGISQDLDSAYDAALRLPQHSHLYEQLQQQKSAADEAEKQRKLKEQAGLARRNAVSVKSATPTTTTGSTAKGIRGAVEEAFNTHLPGRV